MSENYSENARKNIDIQRFISKLDSCFMTNDLAAADGLIDAWRKDAVAAGDKRALLTIENEALGFYRRTGDKEKAEATINSVCSLIEEVGVERKVSGATIYVNLATTMKAFGMAKDGLKYYDMAESIYLDNDMEESYEYSALLNNRASALSELERYDDAEDNLEIALEILQKSGKHDGEMAVGLINLAHLVYDRNSADTDRVEQLLDRAWDKINSANIEHDANYAFIISKCAPSFRYFNRGDEADALEAVAQVIYGGKR